MPTIVEITKRGAGSSSRSLDGREAKRVFIVTYSADSPPASLAEVEVAGSPIPALRDALEGDPTRTVTSIKASPRDGTGLCFTVEAEYATPDDGDIPENPLAMPAEYDWDFGTNSVPYFLDETAPTPKPICNSAGEPFDNMLEREVGDITVTVTRNIATTAWNPITAAEYLSPATAINSDGISIDGVSVGAGQARFGGVRVGPVKAGATGTLYRVMTLVLKLRASWDHKLADRGFHEKSGGKIKEINKGTPPVKPDKPWPLDGNGTAKAASTDTPATLVFKPYPQKPFSVWLS